jgi:hypothetical protein
MRLALSVILPVLFFASCTKQETAPGAGAAQATVLMRDGSEVTGTVLSSSPTEIKVAGADSITRTIPMSQVRSIDYGEPAPAAAAPAPAASTSAPSAPQQAASRPKRIATPEPRHVEHPRPTEAAITSKTLELPVGTELSVRTEETIDSGKAAEGQTFAADVTNDVLDANGDVVIPRGSNAQIVIRSATKGGKIRGASDLVLDLQSVSIDGRSYQISTADMSQKGRDGIGANKRTGEFTGGGAALGAIIGAIAGGGKGAAIGAASGAGAGAVTQIVTRGSIKVPSESVLTFKLDRLLRVVARS